MVRRIFSAKELPVRPELPSELAPLAALCGITDRALLAEAVAALGPKREQGVLQHGAGVAAHLEQLGLTQAQLASLLLRCPYLFSWPAEQRAAVLFGQLMGRLGLTAAEAARCFEQTPTAAGSASFEQAIEALAELFAAAAREEACGTAGGSAEAAFSEAEWQAGERQLGQLLRGSPAVVQLLYGDAATLRQRCAALQQRYGLSAKRLMITIKQCTSLLARDPDRHLAAVEATLQEELGVSGRALVGAMLRTQARAVGCGVDTLRQRCRALVTVRVLFVAWLVACLPACPPARLPAWSLLCTRGRRPPPGCRLPANPAAQVFTLEQLHELKLRPLADLLKASTATWQLTLAVWQALGVADPAALALNNAPVLAYDWLAPGRLANLLALQRALGLSSPGAVVEQGLAGYVAGPSCQRVAGRLLFFEHAGRLPLLVASKQEWRRDRGLPPGKRLPGEPPLISVRAVTRPDSEFCAAAGVSQAALDAFMAGLPSHPPYRQLLADAEAMARQLAAERPEVARLAAERGAGKKPTA